MISEFLTKQQAEEFLKQQKEQEEKERTDQVQTQSKGFTNKL